MISRFNKLRLPPEFAVLGVTGDRYLTDLVSALLEQHDIPFLLKDAGSGEYMRQFGGFSQFGTVIITNKVFYKRAVALLNGINLEVNDNLELFYADGGDEDNESNALSAAAEGDGSNLLTVDTNEASAELDQPDVSSNNSESDVMPLEDLPHAASGSLPETGDFYISPPGKFEDS